MYDKDNITSVPVDNIQFQIPAHGNKKKNHLGIDKPG